MSAVAVEVEDEGVVERCYDAIVQEALAAFGTDIHYLEDMVKVAQRVLIKRAVHVVADD